MRLDNKTLKTIQKILKGKKVILFGSRIYDDKKGGDIDLYIDEDLSIEEIAKIKAKLILNLGDRKIDILSRKYVNNDLLKEIEKGVIIVEKET